MKYFLFFFIITSFAFIPKKIEKRIDKEIKTVFEIENFSKTALVFTEAENKELEVPFIEDNFFKISENEIHLGYFYYGNAPSKTDTFDFVVIFDKDLIIKKIKVLVYRESHGAEIGSKRWLKQFYDLTIENQVTYEKEIKAISGATISARAMTIAINKILLSLKTLQDQNKL